MVRKTDYHQWLGRKLCWYEARAQNEGHTFRHGHSTQKSGSPENFQCQVTGSNFRKKNKIPFCFRGNTLDRINYRNYLARQPSIPNISTSELIFYL